MKVCFYNSHSENNRLVFELSTINHSRYCEKHNYDILNVCEPYIRTIPVDKIKALLSVYDIVATVGSDILFTNINKPITEYPIRDITMAREQHPMKTLNGDFVVFTRNSNLVDLEKIQNETHDAQAALNVLGDKINVCDELQKADPAMNPSFSELLWKPGDFSIHFHQYGVIPNVYHKARYMMLFKQQHPNIP